MDGVLTFSGLAAEPGMKVQGRFSLRSSCGEEVAQVPGGIINGSRPGLTLWLLGGLHGDEPEGMVAIQRVLGTIDPQRLSGAIIGLVTINGSAYAAWERESPLDGKDLNTVFPGDDNCSFTERLAAGLFAVLVAQVSPDDCLLALEGAGRTTMAARLIEVPGTGDAVEERCMRLAETACNPHLRIIARIEERRGDWERIYGGSLFREIVKHVPVARLTIESGSMGTLDEADVLAHCHAVTNILGFLGMYSVERVPPPGPITRTVQNVRILPHRRGFWLRKVGAGEVVDEGQLLAVVVNEVGEAVEQLYAPFRGIILYIRGFGRVDPLSSKLAHWYGINVARYP